MKVFLNTTSAVSANSTNLQNQKANNSVQNSIMNISELSYYPNSYYLPFTGANEVKATSTKKIDDEISYDEIKNIRTIDDLGNLHGKSILLRVDFNVARDENGNITDDTRIVEALPTIDKLHEQGAKTIIVSHLDKPKGKVNPKMSLNKVAERLGELLNQDVKFIPKLPYSNDVDDAIEEMKPGDVIMLENIRFTPDEEGKDTKIKDDNGNTVKTIRENKTTLSFRLASLADAVVFDAFGAAHRDHASTAGAMKLHIPAAQGLLMEKELNELSQLMIEPEDFTAIVGGAKISTKIDVLRGLINKGDIETIIVGGAMAHAFLQAEGIKTGNSYMEATTDDCDPVAVAREVMDLADEKGVELLLPIDVVVKNIDSSVDEHKVVSVKNIQNGWAAYDIGPATRKIYANAISDSKTIFWNGPMGKFEDEGYDEGTNAIADAVASATRHGAISVAGGGDTISAINASGHSKKDFTHISTGGGASLEFVEGKMLPSVQELIKNSRRDFTIIG